MGWTLPACCVGNFDGVHLGHRALVARAREVAATGAGQAEVVALVFDPHPLSVVAPQRVPPRVSTYAQRERWLGEAGADRVERLDPGAGILERSPEEFLGMLAEMGFTGIVEGEDFRFGAGRAGDAAMLKRLGGARGMAVEIVEPVSAALSDCSLVRASSTVLRWLLRHGRVGDVGHVAGRPHEIEGTVVQGDRVGRQLGYPTANIETECMVPADGVYAGEAVLPNGRRVMGAISVGRKPSFGGDRHFVEVYLLDVGRDAGLPSIAGLPEYGWDIRLSFEAYVRDQVAFSSLEALVAQIERDVARVRELLSRPPEVTRVAPGGVPLVGGHKREKVSGRS